MAGLAFVQILLVTVLFAVIAIFGVILGALLDLYEMVDLVIRGTIGTFGVVLAAVGIWLMYKGFFESDADFAIVGLIVLFLAVLPLMGAMALGEF